MIRTLTFHNSAKTLNRFTIAKTAFVLTIFLLSHCAFVTIPNALTPKPITAEPKGKLGVVVIPNIKLNLMVNRTSVPIFQEEVPKLLEEKSKGKTQFTYIDALGDGDDFDYTQDYLNIQKKNILEFRYEYERIKVNPLLGILGGLTLGIIPFQTTYRLNTTVILYDSNGKAIPMPSIDPRPSINEWRSWLLFPFQGSRSNENDYIKHIVSETISVTLEEIETKNITITSFETNYKKVNLPARMVMSPPLCGPSVPYGPKYNQILTAGKGKTLCRVNLLFKNNTDQTIYFRSSDFKMILGEDEEISTMDSVSRKKEDLVQMMGESVMLNPKEKNSRPSMSIYFSYPSSSKKLPTKLRYFDKELSPVPIEIEFFVPGKTE